MNRKSSMMAVLSTFEVRLFTRISVENTADQDRESPAARIFASLHNRNTHGHLPEAVFRCRAPGAYNCEPAESKCIWISPKSSFLPQLKEKSRAPEFYTLRDCELVQSKCTQIPHKRSPMREFTEKCRTLELWLIFCAGMDISPQKFIAKIYRENATPQNLGPYFVRACTIEMHIDILQTFENLQEKYRDPWSELPLRRRLFARLRRRNAHGHRTKPLLGENLG